MGPGAKLINKTRKLLYQEENADAQPVRGAGFREIGFVLFCPLPPPKDKLLYWADGKDEEITTIKKGPFFVGTNSVRRELGAPAGTQHSPVKSLPSLTEESLLKLTPFFLFYC